MGEQVADGAAAGRRAGQMQAERVGESQPALVAQPQDQDRHERLGDRADPVLGVAVGHVAVHGSPDVRPHHVAVADHRGHDRGCPALDLGGGELVQQGAPGAGQQFEGHARNLQAL